MPQIIANEGELFLTEKEIGSLPPLTKNDAARFIGISKQQLYNMIDDKKIVPIKSKKPEENGRIAFEHVVRERKRRMSA